jgi:hypothetical protein
MRILFGNGEVATEERFVTAFKAIILRGFGSLRVHRGEQRIEISCDSNILPFISTAVSGGELRIGLKPLAWALRTSGLDIDVTLPELSGLGVSGSGSASVDAFSGEGFLGSVSGSGTVSAVLDYARATFVVSGSAGLSGVVAASGLELRSSGSGAVTLVGSTEHAVLKLSGSASVSAKDFGAAEADVDMSGSGRVELRAAKILRARLSGSSELRYWGDPSVASRLSGSGRIKGLGE